MKIIQEQNEKILQLQSGSAPTQKNSAEARLQLLKRKLGDHLASRLVERNNSDQKFMQPISSKKVESEQSPNLKNLHSSISKNSIGQAT